MSKLLIHSSHGKEDPERATLPFIVGKNAVLAGQETVILLTIEGVWLATSGGAEGIQKDGLPRSERSCRSTSTEAARCGPASRARTLEGSARSSSWRGTDRRGHASRRVPLAGAASITF